MPVVEHCPDTDTDWPEARYSGTHMGWRDSTADSLPQSAHYSGTDTDYPLAHYWDIDKDWPDSLLESEEEHKDHRALQAVAHHRDWPDYKE